MKQDFDQNAILSSKEKSYSNGGKRYISHAKIIENIYGYSLRHVLIIVLGIAMILIAKLSFGNIKDLANPKTVNITNQMLSDDNIIWFRAGAYNIKEQNKLFDPTFIDELGYNGFERDFGYYIVKLAPGYAQEDLDEILDIASRVSGDFYPARFYYVPNDAWIYRLPKKSLEDVESLEQVVWTGPLVPSLRVLPALAQNKQESDEDDGLIGIKIQVFQDDDYQALAELLSQQGAIIIDSTKGAHHEFIKLRIQPKMANEIAITAANYEGTEWVERYYPDYPVNDWSRWITQSYNFEGMRHGIGGADLSAQMVVDYEHVPVYRRGIYGQDQIVGFCDSGLDTNSAFFYDAGVEVPKQVGWSTPGDTYHRKIRAYNYGGIDMGDFDDIDEEMHGHGTHVGGSIGGNNYANDPMDGIYDAADGMAPLCRLVVTDGADGTSGIYTPTDMNTMFQYARNCGAFIHSNSYGSSRPNYYNSNAQECDEFMYFYQDFIILFAAGNDNNGSSPARVATYNCSKNIVSVGATETGFGSGGSDWSAHGSGDGADPENMAPFSSHGPTDEGLLKPNISVPGGWNIWSADNVDGGSGGHTSIRKMGGTSMACPTAAGLTALIRQYFMEGYYPTGSPQIENRMFPSGALMKAMLINGTRNMTGRYTISEIGDDGVQHAPSNGQGWGRVVLDDCMYFDDDYGTDERKLMVHDEITGFNSTGDIRDFYVQCGESETQPIKIVLSYSDYPGSPAAGTPGVNDLDLIVSIEDNVYRGNVFASSGARSITGGSADRINRDEVVWLDPVPGALIVVTVEASRIAHSPQRFALVMSGDISEGIPNDRPEAPIYSNWLFDNARIDDPQPELIWQVPEDGDGHDLHFVLEYDDSADFGDPIAIFRTDESAIGFTGGAFPVEEGTGEAISFNFETPLEDGTYWWRVRAYDGITYSNWTHPRSFTIGSDDSVASWYQTTGQQFTNAEDYDAVEDHDQMTLRAEMILIDEDFERYDSVEEFESFWTTWGEFYSLSRDIYHSANQSLFIHDDSWREMSWVNINFEPLEAGYIEGWSLTSDSDDQSFIITLYKDDERKSQVYNREGYVALWDGVSRHNLVEIDPAEWHHYRLDFDCEADEIYCTIDGTDVFGPYPFTGGAPENIEELRIGTFNLGWTDPFYCQTFYDDYKVGTSGDNYGYIVSNPIISSDNPEGDGFDRAFWTQEAGDSIIITVQVKTGGVWGDFASATTDGETGIINLALLPTEIDTIRLRADIFADGEEEPNLYDWGVNWNPGEAVQEAKAEKPEQLLLITSPNPFNSAISIETGISANIQIRDHNGRIVTELNTGKSSSIVWNPDKNLPSGVYIISANDGKKHIISRALYIK
ncbi:MAG: S8 family serine peptidase [Candidatus Zixiibacteriota bacterium]